jgi:hypothetical protein
MSGFTVAALFIGAFILWRLIRPTRQRRQVAASSAPAFHWPPLGEFDFEIVGESHYQSEISRLAGNHGDHGANAEHVALLIPEDSNPHDSKAVAVAISGQTVGYLTREDARSFRRRLSQKGLKDQVTSCQACIAGGGTRRNGERLFYGVRLDIKPFE